MTPAIVWFRQDLRLQDNPALAAAVRRGGPVIPVYVLDDEGEGAWPAGAASRWWRHHSLVSLGESLRGRGSRLVLARGASPDVLLGLAARTGAGAVYWNRLYEPAAIALESAVRAALAPTGIEAHSFNASLLFEPEAVSNRQGRPFQVFTPFWRHCLGLKVAPPVRLARGPIAAPSAWPRSLEPAHLGLLPRIRWDAGLARAWKPGEKPAALRLAQFVRGALGSYDRDRDLPGLEGTSALSPSLHFGEVGPRQVWAAVRSLSAESGVFPVGKGARVFLAELGWREFAHHLLFHFPRTPSSPLRPEFTHFPWRPDPGGARLRAWQRGLTGYPIVDAGMRQLWSTGWMHNRVRMIAASFLVKDLMVPWIRGAEWFWNTLVDADLANNTLGWQWTAGCGADAAPFFRIFSPERQGLRFDADGAYVRKWVPELGTLPGRFLHAPWEAPEDLRRGLDYPGPIVDHGAARTLALDAYARMRISARA